MMKTLYFLKTASYLLILYCCVALWMDASKVMVFASTSYVDIPDRQEKLAFIAKEEVDVDYLKSVLKKADAAIDSLYVFSETQNAIMTVLAEKNMSTISILLPSVIALILAETFEWISKKKR